MSQLPYENDRLFPRPWLHERLWAALNVIQPNLIFACYGMNDGIYHPQTAERFQAFQTGALCYWANLSLKT